MSFIVETCLSETYPIIDSNPGITNYKLFAGWSTIDLSKRREAVKVREEDSHKPRIRDGQ